MKYLSEKTNKAYNSIEELSAAEKDFDAKQAQIEKKNSERKSRAKEVEDAYKDILKARDKYNELLDKFIKDYGSYHYSVSNINASRANDMLDNLFDSFFSLF